MASEQARSKVLMKKSVLHVLLIIAFGVTALSPIRAEDLIYVAVDPCRIVDTREAGGAIIVNNFRNFLVSGTLGELSVQGGKADCLAPKPEQKPYAISAYVIAVPAPGSTAGVLTAYPSDQLPPPVGAGSTVNFAAGQITGNTTNITLCESDCPTDGEFAVLARNTDEHVVVDIQGYFYPMPIESKPEPTARFVDNGDGTFSDNETGLMWEKKENYDNVIDRTNPHDADNLYTWTYEDDSDLTNPDGTLFYEFLALVNKTTTIWTDPPLGKHTDWRIPTIWEANQLTYAHGDACFEESGDIFWFDQDNPCPQLESILGPIPFGGGGINPNHGYWSSSSIVRFDPPDYEFQSRDLTRAFGYYFRIAETPGYEEKKRELHARAVRRFK